MEEAAVHCDRDIENGDAVEIVPLQPEKRTSNSKKSTEVVAGERRRSTRPVLFEQAARGWWNPRYSSMSLENEYQKLSFPQTKRRYRYALIYVILACVSWCIFFAVMRRAHWGTYLTCGLILLVFTGIVLAVTFWSEFYKLRKCNLTVSIIHTALLFLFALLPFMYIVDFPDMSIVGMFTTVVEILLLIYTVIPLPFYVSIGFGVTFSIIFEILNAFFSLMKTPEVIIGRALLHICIHTIGIHISIMTQVRKRSTFLKVGQSVMIRHDLAKEKDLKERMIESLMPLAVAEKARREMEGIPDDDSDPDRKSTIFRALHVSDQQNVSILFADIVGFTHMSSNKTAPQLVALLNDLFGRFDVLCKQSNCEKISTLGDCYYCVAGCPNPRDDHAKCCVEMGLAMCIAIQEFDRDHNEEVNMRVGVHTGTVLCGIVGVRRFKFDVWSHDVTLANMMESSGRPGRVHISNDTYLLVKDIYEMEKGEAIEDIRKDKKLEEKFDRATQKFIVGHVEETKKLDTWFVVKRKSQGDGILNSTSPAAINISVDNETSQIEPDAVSVPLMTQHEPTIDIDHGTDDVALVEQLHKQRRLREKEKTDQHIVLCMEKDCNVHSYLYQPPINHFTFNFVDPKIESDFRNHFFQDEVENVPTLALPRYSLFADLIVALVFFCLISVSLFLTSPLSVSWILFFACSLVMYLIPMIAALLLVCHFQPSCMHKAGCALMQWYPRQAIGAILASLPAVGVFVCFSCPAFNKPDTNDIFYCLCLIVALLHLCNFTLLSCWLKSSLATIYGIILLVLLFFGVCKVPEHKLVYSENMTTFSPTTVTAAYLTTVLVNRTDAEQVFAGDHPLRYEIFLNVGLLLILIWFLNCEFEINYRLSFYGNVQAKGDREKMEVEKKQADMLLHNIIPVHVWEALKKSTRGNDKLKMGEGDVNTKDVIFGEKHQNVGVIFARITNFDDLYEEGYEGGKEFLRVLNQIMSDFELLLDEDKYPQYKDIEKIKTIGSCLMAASGMNPSLRKQNKDPKAHLYALMDFAIELLHILEDFNRDMMSFHFEMCIGYNFGDVVAGVVGKTKLLYDIWGDTVNISSRMYSTGEHGRIQVTEEVAKALGDKFEFEERGTVFVKGKGDMNVYLLVRKKPGASWD